VLFGKEDNITDAVVVKYKNLFLNSSGINYEIFHFKFA
jgi:hypothetical protein